MDIEGGSLTTKRWSRWATIVTTAIVCGALLFANFDGYQNEPFGSDNFFGELPLINWTHGWPSICLVRNSIYPVSGIYSSGGKSFSGPYGTNSRWPFDGTLVTFWIKPFLIDCAFFVLVLFGTAYTTPRLIGWLKMWKQFSLRSLLAATTLLAIVFAIFIPLLLSASVQHFLKNCFGASVLPTTKFRYALQLSAIAAIAIGTALTLFTVLHVAYRIYLNYRLRWRTVGRQYQLTDAQHPG